VQREKNTSVILIIDPEQHISELIHMGLQHENLQIVSAPDGIEGIRLAQQIQPALIITELLLPYIDGFEVCRRLRNHHKTRDIPILVLSSTKQSRESSLAAGANDYLSKPCNLEELLQHVLTLLPDDILVSQHILSLRYNVMAGTQTSMLTILEEWTDQALQQKLKLSD